MASVEATHTYEVEADPLAAIEFCYEQGWTDGLPVIPPESSRVEAMLAMEGRPAETVIAAHPTTGLECSIQAAAVNAVMAGCLPEYFPLVIAALEAANEPGFNFHASTASTGGSATLLIVSGPAVEDLGMNSGASTFGPGNRANATVGRAMRLIIMNVFKMIPGISDQSTQGHPGKYSFCIAERADKCPWDPLHIEQGYGEDISSVTVFAGSGFFNVENHGGNTPESILDCVADSMANLGCITIGQSVVILSPEHAEIVASTGWTKAQVQEYLFEQAKQTVENMEACGKFVPREYQAQEREDMHRGMNAEDILITVAGGDAGGHSAFIPSWSRTRASIMQHKPIGVCIDC
ncbi:MAG: hypothetical protein O7B25_10395 [Gammaproteobacteria bacterium]|nr:hypothetical protein [Gammaproteobacteria bacterium]